MKIKSQGFLTDLMFHQERAEIEKHEDYMVIKTPDNPYYFPGGSITTAQTLYYDQINGNLLGAQDEGGRKIINTYGGEDSKLLLATTINADPSTLLVHSGFDYNVNNNTANFLMDNNNIYKDDWFAGIGCYRTSASNSTILKMQGLNTSEKYKCTFWIKAALNPLDGTTYNINPYLTDDNGNIISISKTHSIKSGWSLYEAVITGTTKVYIQNFNPQTPNIYSCFLIDELNLYPISSKIKSVAFNELGQKTCEIDDNSRIIYFDYDALGRIKTEMDENRNVLKAYRYNYKQ